jgi:hypothetical protein
MYSLNTDYSAGRASCCRVGLELRELCSELNMSLLRFSMRIDARAADLDIIDAEHDDIFSIKYGCDKHPLKFMLSSLRTMHLKWIALGSDQTNQTRWVASRVERPFRALIKAIEIIKYREGGA